MPRISLPQLEVVYKDIFVLLSLYRFMHKWFMENEYVDAGGNIALEDSGEILYMEKHGTHHNANEREVRWWWRTQKKPVNIGTAGSKFYQHHIDLDFWAFQMTDREIMQEGKKTKVQHAELRILLKPYIEVQDLTKTPILKYFDYWFRTRLIKKNLEENRKIIYQDAYKLQASIKRYLDLKTWQPEEESFHENLEFI